MAAARPRPRSRAAAQQQPQGAEAFVGLVVAVGAVAGLVGLWFGAPGLVVTWLAWTVASWAVTPPELTGVDNNRMPIPQGPREEKKQRRFNFARSAKWGLVMPFHAVWPGWPVKAAFLGGLLTAAAFFLLPHYAIPGYPPYALNLLDAAFAHILVTQLAAARRDSVVLGDRSPGVAVDGLKGLFVEPGSSPLAALPRIAKLGLAVVAGLVGAGATWFYVAVPVTDLTTPLGPATAPAWAILGFLGGLAAAIGPAWVTASLTHWRTVVAARKEWAPSWTMLKHLNPPQLLDRQKIGPAIVDTFRADGSLGAQTYLPLGPKILQTRGTAHRIAVHAVPARDPQGQPIPGSSDPLGFQIVSWPNDFGASLADPALDPEIAKLYLESTFAWLGEGWGAPPILDQMTPLAAEGSESQTWMITLHSPGPLGWEGLRKQGAASIGAYTGAQALVDHRDPQASKPSGKALYIGNLTGDPQLVEDTPISVEDLEYLSYEDEWNGRWSAVLKQDVNPPTPNRATRSTETLPTGQEINRIAFVTRQGVDPRDFFNQESKVAATLNGAPFVAITGWLLTNRPGERHAQAFAVYWSNQAMPSNPDKLTPAAPPERALAGDRGRGRPSRGGRGARPGPPASVEAQKWVLAGIINDAFKAARLARPEVHKVRCLTDASSRGHIWSMNIRLFDGVTLADVRGAAQRLRQQMGSEWLRVEAASDGITIVAGVSPKRATISNKRDADWLVSLDWEQAWLDSKISGVGGFTPKLGNVDHLPANEQVQVLDFALPSGLAVGDVKAATSKLETATGNAFVEVRDHPSGKPDQMRLLVCEINPLPERVSFDFEAADVADGIAFATGVEGEPVVFDPTSSPHALLAGVTGAGKSVLAQNFLYGFLARPGGAEVYVIDPVKGGADFQFAKPYAKAFADDPFQAAGVMKSIYAEVVRRKNENARHGVGSYLDLPSPPQPIVVMIDEFTSLMGQNPVPKPSDDPETEKERALLIAENDARAQVGIIAGKLAREARSAGVTLLLGTQKLTAKLLDTIPGSGDLKTNLARVLLGKASYGDRASALRAFDTAPMLEGNIPKGRGLWESLTAGAIVMQTWYATQDTFSTELATRARALSPDEMLDMSRFKAPELEVDGEIISGPAPVPARPTAQPEPQIIDAGEVEFSLDDLELTLDDLEDELGDTAEDSTDEEQVETAPEPENPSPVDVPSPFEPAEYDPAWADMDPEPATATDELDIEAALAAANPDDEPAGEQPDEDPFAAATEPEPENPSPEEVQPEPEPEVEVVTVAAHIVWDEIDPTPWTPASSDYGWEEIDAFEAFLAAFPQVTEVTWTDPQLLTDGPDGRLLDIVLDIAEPSGVVVHGPVPAPTTAPVPAATPAPAPAISAPAPSSGSNLVDFDFDEQPAAVPHTASSNPVLYVPAPGVADDFDDFPDIPVLTPRSPDEDPFA